MNKIKSKLIAGGLLVSFLAYTSPVLAYAKDETVYSKVNTEGETYKTIVSTQLEDGTQTQEETDKIHFKWKRNVSRRIGREKW